MEETERRCNKCGQIKPIGAFEPAKRYRNGRMPVCRADYRSKLHRREREPVGATKQCRGCSDIIKDLADFTKDKRSPDGYTPRCASCRRKSRAAESKDVARARFLRWKYGITAADYDAMLERQGGSCAVCDGQQDHPTRQWFDVDHCHTTGHVRGLLCSSCNTALGLLREDPARIGKLAVYAQMGVAA